MRVALFDDDLLTRAGARKVLGAEPDIEVAAAFSLRHGLELPVEVLGRFDCVLVDVHDRTRERWEEGTDVYAGIELVERIRSSGSLARVVAVTPIEADTLLTERLIGCRVDEVHERCDFQRPADVVAAALHPSPCRRPVRFPPWALIEEGIGLGADVNRAMTLYKSSSLYGLIRPDATQLAIGSRRAAVSLRDQVIATGFVGSGTRPRWNEVRDYLLRLAGRLPVRWRPPPPVPCARPPAERLRSRKRPDVPMKRS